MRGGKVHTHRFLATASTNALNRGMLVQDVQVLLGHEDIGTTMIYCTGPGITSGRSISDVCQHSLPE
ncbi:MAG: site-specific integrase [Lachnospiraceae bacterium]|nr:site-specific integrase [Lachnospiraceae bacterium]MCI9135726.1 site-specific integrase [Lachnospiraceae bacterium]